MKNVDNRVELHCNLDEKHIKVYQRILRQAERRGDTAIAVSNPKSIGWVGHIQKYNERLKNPLKLLVGMELEVVNDVFCIAPCGWDASIDTDIILMDIETSGPNYDRDSIIQIFATKYSEGKVIDTFCTYVNPGVTMPISTLEETFISHRTLMEAPMMEEALPELIEFCESLPIISYYQEYQSAFLHKAAKQLNLHIDNVFIGMIDLIDVIAPGKGHVLNAVLLETLGGKGPTEKFGPVMPGIYKCIRDELCRMGLYSFEEIKKYYQKNKEIGKSQKKYLIYVLARNNSGVKMLFDLCEKSEEDILYISDVIENRENLLIGSSYQMGLLFAYQNKYPGFCGEKDLVKFYDFLEIEPESLQFYDTDQKAAERIGVSIGYRDYNTEIIELGEKYGCPVVVSGNVSYQKSLKCVLNTKKQTNYLHTARELLQEFSYLGEEMAEKIVIKNQKRIAEMVKGLCK